MKLGSTNFLRLVVFLMGLIVLGLCIFTMPLVIREDTGKYGPIVLIMYAAAVPFIIALYQTIKLLGYIDKNKAFSDLTVNALKKVKYSALTISALYSVGMPFIFQAGDKDDAPGVILLGLVFSIAPFVVATSAAVLQKLIQNAVDIKSENDLTV